MIIGEKNLIIGFKNSFISNFSISLFFYIEKHTNYLLTNLCSIFKEIIPTVASPPFLLCF